MKVLTLTQPWATLVATGHKLIETRSWYTKYRGQLAIHAAKGFPEWARGMCYGKPFQSALGDYDFDPVTLPVGMIIATCELVDVVQMNELHVFPACQGYGCKRQYWKLDEKERAFGDYQVGRYMWLLANVKKLNKPITAKGALGLWNFDMPTSEEILA